MRAIYAILMGNERARAIEIFAIFILCRHPTQYDDLLAGYIWTRCWKFHNNFKVISRGTTRYLLMEMLTMPNHLKFGNCRPIVTDDVVRYDTVHLFPKSRLNSSSQTLTCGLCRNLTELHASIIVTTIFITVPRTLLLSSP